MTKRNKSLKNISFTNAARKRQQTLNWLLDVDWPFIIWFSLFIGLFQRNFSILARKMRHSARQSDNQPKLNVYKGVTSVLNYGNASRVLDTHLAGGPNKKCGNCGWGPNSYPPTACYGGEAWIYLVATSLHLLNNWFFFGQRWQTEIYVCSWKSCWMT